MVKDHLPCGDNAVDAGFARRSGRDCRNPEAMEGSLHSPPCVLDTGNPCRYDGCVNSITMRGGQADAARSNSASSAATDGTSRWADVPLGTPVFGLAGRFSPKTSRRVAPSYSLRTVGQRLDGLLDVVRFLGLFQQTRALPLLVEGAWVVVLGTADLLGERLEPRSLFNEQD